MALRFSIPSTLYYCPAGSVNLCKRMEKKGVEPNEVLYWWGWGDGGGGLGGRNRRVFL